jgi:hypothetical protein
MHALPVTCPVNVAALDEKDPEAGGANHRYAIQFGGPQDVCVIQFQHGARGVEGSKAGVFEDALLAILADRMEGFQGGKFACAENGVALEHIQRARAALNERIAKRMAKSVLGVNENH